MENYTGTVINIIRGGGGVGKEKRKNVSKIENKSTDERETEVQNTAKY